MSMKQELKLWLFACLVCILLLFVSSNQVQHCNSIGGVYKQETNKCYRVFLETKITAEANSKCRLDGFDSLVRIESSNEYQSVYSILNLDNEGAHYHVDGERVSRTNNFKFGDGKQMKYYDWGPGQPNGLQHSQDCLMIYVENRVPTLYDYLCNEAHPYICQKPYCPPNTCGLNEICVFNDTCTCKSNYYGHQCLDYDCFGKNKNLSHVCSGNGVCSSPNDCTCKEGYEGKNCENYKCYGVEFINASVCSENGICVSPNNCSCKEGYSGNKCETLECFGIQSNNVTTCSGNGICVSPNNCSCKDGYYGDTCEKFNCYGVEFNNTNVCSGNGICKSPNNCTCKEAYYGSKCGNYHCYGVEFNNTNVCSGNGICKSPNNCTCKDGYYGNSCGDYNCYGVQSKNVTTCSGNGICTSPNNCTCKDGYYSNKCENFYCYGVEFNNTNVCSGNGICMSPKNCTCKEGYSGSKCETLECFGVQYNNVTTCSGNGICASPNNCTCKDGYYGNSCGDYNCYGVQSKNVTTCSGNGICTSPNNCTCKDGYYSNKCENFYCYGVEFNNTNVCSGNGICISPNNCTCKEGYYGNICQDYDCFEVSQNASIVCSSKGSCISPDLCSCVSGYFGNNCSRYECYGIPHNSSNVCNKKGICIHPDYCICNQEYYGDKCDQFNCSNVPYNDIDVCNSHGTCISFNNCSCKVGYYGTNCEHFDCYGVNSNLNTTCSGNGKCYKPDKCSCNITHTGEKCDLKSASCKVEGISTFLQTQRASFEASIFIHTNTNFNLSVYAAIYAQQSSHPIQIFNLLSPQNTLVEYSNFSTMASNFIVQYIIKESSNSQLLSECSKEFIVTRLRKIEIVLENINKTISPNDDIKVDASKSYDVDFPAAILKYQWSCDELNIASQSLNQSSILIKSDLLRQSAYYLCNVTVFSDEIPNIQPISSSSIFFLQTSNNDFIPKITLKKKKSYFSSNERVIVDANIELPSSTKGSSARSDLKRRNEKEIRMLLNEALNYKFVWREVNGKVILDEKSTYFGSFLKPTLIIRENVLNATESYLLEIKILNEEQNENYVSSIAVSVESPPYGGDFIVVQNETSKVIEISTYGWKVRYSDDSLKSARNETLVYDYSFEYNGNSYFLSSFSTDNKISSSFPSELISTEKEDIRFKVKAKSVLSNSVSVVLDKKYSVKSKIVLKSVGDTINFLKEEEKKLKEAESFNEYQKIAFVMASKLQITNYSLDRVNGSSSLQNSTLVCNNKGEYNPKFKKCECNDNFKGGFCEYTPSEFEELKKFRNNILSGVLDVLDKTSNRTKSVEETEKTLVLYDSILSRPEQITPELLIKSIESVNSLIESLSNSEKGSFLAVLKTLGIIDSLSGFAQPKKTNNQSSEDNYERNLAKLLQKTINNAIFGIKNNMEYGEPSKIIETESTIISIEKTFLNEVKKGEVSYKDKLVSLSKEFIEKNKDLSYSISFQSSSVKFNAYSPVNISDDISSIVSFQVKGEGSQKRLIDIVEKESNITIPLKFDMKYENLNSSTEFGTSYMEDEKNIIQTKSENGTFIYKEIKCMYWNVQQFKWKSDGCSTDNIRVDQISCKCRQTLGTYAVFLEQVIPKINTLTIEDIYNIKNINEDNFQVPIFVLLFNLSYIILVLVVPFADFLFEKYHPYTPYYINKSIRKLNKKGLLRSLWETWKEENMLCKVILRPKKGTRVSRIQKISVVYGVLFFKMVLIGVFFGIKQDNAAQSFNVLLLSAILPIPVTILVGKLFNSIDSNKWYFSFRFFKKNRSTEESLRSGKNMRYISTNSTQEDKDIDELVGNASPSVIRVVSPLPKKLYNEPHSDRPSSPSVFYKSQNLSKFLLREESQSISVNCSNRKENSKTKKSKMNSARISDVDITKQTEESILKFGITEEEKGFLFLDQKLFETNNVGMDTRIGISVQDRIDKNKEKRQEKKRFVKKIGWMVFLSPLYFFEVLLWSFESLLDIIDEFFDRVFNKCDKTIPYISEVRRVVYFLLGFICVSVVYFFIVYEIIYILSPSFEDYKVEGSIVIFCISLIMYEIIIIGRVVLLKPKREPGVNGFNTKKKLLNQRSTTIKRISVVCIWICVLFVLIGVDMVSIFTFYKWNEYRFAHISLLVVCLSLIMISICLILWLVYRFAQLKKQAIGRSKVLNESIVEDETKLKETKKKFKLPPIFMIFTFVLFYIYCIGMSIVMMAYGVRFGNDIVLKWLRAFLLAVWISMSVKEPIMVSVKFSYFEIFTKAIENIIT